MSQETEGVCVSVYGRSLLGLIGRLESARSFNPEFIELRLDYLGSIRTSDLEEIRRHLRGNEIMTFRKHTEGGLARIDENTRKNILLDIISICRPTFLDIEISTLESLPIIAHSLRNSNSRLIASSHNFVETEQTSDLRKLVKGVAVRYSPSYVKVVRKANEFDDNLRVLSLYKIIDKSIPQN